MYCGNCGTELPDEANFCWKCGKAQQDASEVLENKWEYCEIIVEDVGSWYSDAFFFTALAIGPRGAYTAARSTRRSGLPRSTDKKQVAACEAFVQQLLEDGWEPVSEKGPRWYAYKFRRSVQGGADLGS